MGQKTHLKQQTKTNIIYVTAIIFCLCLSSCASVGSRNIPLENSHSLEKAIEIQKEQEKIIGNAITILDGIEIRKLDDSHKKVEDKLLFIKEEIDRILKLQESK